MNILIDELPESLKVGDLEYKINPDFRACLSIILAFEDSELTGSEKAMVLLGNLFEELPKDLPEALEVGLEFLNGPTSNSESSDSPKPRLYSFAKDSNLIYAAFRQTHGIDLHKEDLHWWKFLALFMDLGQDTTFCNLISLRKRVKTGKASKEEKASAREMGDMFHVPEIDTRTVEEREMERKFLEAIGQNDG